MDGRRGGTGFGFLAAFEAAVPGQGRFAKDEKWR